MSSTTISLILAGGAIVISCLSVGWQVFTWRESRRSEVTVEIDGPRWMKISSGAYEIDVVVRNRGPVAEGVEEIILEFPVINDELGSVGGQSVWQRNVGDPEVPPRRNLRKTFDLVDLSRWSPFPASVVAHVTLESGEIVKSAAYLPSKTMLEVCMAGLETNRDLTADLPEDSSA